MLRLIALIAMLVPRALAAGDIVSAAYVEPTGVYGHGALPAGEYAALRVDYADGRHDLVRFEAAVFEDTAPRLHDFDGDGLREIVTVVSSFDQGAMIQVFGLVDDRLRPLGRTAPIGQRHRWLAIAGIADFDRDGRDDIAYVDRPHLARVLRVVTAERRGDTLDFTPLGTVEALTNHRFGSPVIEGGVRDCPGAAPAIVTSDRGWDGVIETRWDGRGFVTERIGGYSGPESLAAALVCD